MHLCVWLSKVTGGVHFLLTISLQLHPRLKFSGHKRHQSLLNQTYQSSPINKDWSYYASALRSSRCKVWEPRTLSEEAFQSDISHMNVTHWRHVASCGSFVKLHLNLSPHGGLKPHVPVQSHNQMIQVAYS